MEWNSVKNKDFKDVGYLLVWTGNHWLHRFTIARWDTGNAWRDLYNNDISGVTHWAKIEPPMPRQGGE